MRCRMYVAVLAASAILVLTTATGSSADASCTASLPALVKGAKCISALLQGLIHCILPGHTPGYPANSCTELAEQEPDIPSGNYWILNSTQSSVQVFCEMGEVFPSTLNVTGGWVRVANLNMTDPNQQCPGNLTLSHTNPIRLCGRRTDSSCDSVTFTTYGVRYQQVCGRVKGYQVASPDGFQRYPDSHNFCPAPCTLDKPYVDGVSITHGASPREHIWTYAAGVTANSYHSAPANCPCTGSGAPPPNFVGSDYYCESGLDFSPWRSSVLYSDDPLWDGQDCNGRERTCCDPSNLPWFCKELPEPTTDNLEFRICADEPRTNEDTPIELVKLYIQ